MWSSSIIQVVWFPVNLDGIDASRTYVELTGSEVDGFERNRVPSQKTPFLSRAHGLFEGKSYRVQVSPGRVDWYIEPQLQEDDPAYETLLDTEAVLLSIQQAIQNVSEELIGDVTRVSIVTRLIHQVATPELANDELVRMCNLPLPPEGLKDLAFQANRRKPHPTGAELNRLVKFSIETASLVVVSFNQQTGRAIQTTPQKDERYAVRVDLDFNTVPSGDVFGIDQQRELFDALIDETRSASDDPSIEILNR